MDTLLQPHTAATLRQPQATVKVAFQGVRGCFHDAAAQAYFQDCDIEGHGYDTFQELTDAVASRRTPGLIGLMAIENTIAGSLLANHELLRRSGLEIAGEHKMRISHVLCALPGQSIDDIEVVESHPMALMQCEEFLMRHPGMRKVEKTDTAGSAQDIAEQGLRGHAAVCGAYAARLYGLDILAEGIETNRHNFTRFLVVTPRGLTGPARQGARADKASLVLTLPHEQGALSKVLAILSFYGMNLTKIQSMPIVGREWEYRFYIDLAFDDHSRYSHAVEAVRPLTVELSILGEYADCPSPLQGC